MKGMHLQMEGAHRTMKKIKTTDTEAHCHHISEKHQSCHFAPSSLLAKY